MGFRLGVLSSDWGVSHSHTRCTTCSPKRDYSGGALRTIAQLNAEHEERGFLIQVSKS